jgi:hypothetical protein
MGYSYPIILVAVLILSPIVIKLAARQDRKTKGTLRKVFLSLLFLQLISGFFNWETFSGPGRTGLELSIEFPSSFLGLFFAVTTLQIIFLLIPRRVTDVGAVVLNFANTAVFFAGVILASRFVGEQIVSLFNVGAVFAVLIGNVVGLAYINQHKNILANYSSSQRPSVEGKKPIWIKLLNIIGWVVIGAVLISIFVIAANSFF